MPFVFWQCEPEKDTRRLTKMRFDMVYTIGWLSYTFEGIS
jgi:hypothetical protein